MRKDFPILFQPDMVRAILERRATQTRRIPNRYNATWQVGDHLWVKERFKYDDTFEGGGIPRLGITYGKAIIWQAGSTAKGPWKSSLFMPRWASRLTLEVAQVRLQRLQEITEEDAIAEGCPSKPWYRVPGGPLKWYQSLWDSINARRGYPWESNPWVQAITFEMVSHAWREHQDIGA